MDNPRDLSETIQRPSSPFPPATVRWHGNSGNFEALCNAIAHYLRSNPGKTMKVASYNNGDRVTARVKEILGERGQAYILSMADEKLLEIRCHQAVYEAGPDYDLRCTHCQSLHPMAFIEQIQNGKFQRGWFYENDQPIMCEMAEAQFYAVHLLDMPKQWLYENALTIYRATGVLFFYKENKLTASEIEHGQQYSAATPHNPTDLAIKQAQAALDHYKP
jgi:hypothetical protein